MNMLEDQIRKNILNSFTQSEVEKGVYTDNWLNRKLGRVGKEYTKKEGNKKEKDNLTLRREIKKGKVSIKYKDGTFIDDLGKFIKDSKYIKYNSEEGFVDRSKLHKENPFKK